MSFVTVDFFGARKMADELEGMSKECAAMAAETGVMELKALSAKLGAIANDVRRACNAREALDTGILDGLRPNYGEVIK